ncbi:hypothetical protein ACEQ8H_005620 [Pleosporales sp. CAS-2024a]
MLARGMSRPLRFFLVALAVYGFMWIKAWPRYYDDEELPPSMRAHTGSAMGPHRVGHDHLVVSIVTTATDVYTKLAPSLVYMFPEDLDPTLLFADLRMNVGDWPVFDAIYEYSSDLISRTKELDRYWQLVEYARRKIPLDMARRQDPKEEATIQAALHKYKILQAMARAWDYRPDRSWYAFINEDTFIDRVNTLDWLAQYNPTTKWFFGNPPTPGVADGFAVGGNSFILSSAAMNELFSEPFRVVSNWESKIATYTSAYDVVSAILQAELNLSMTAAWPGISGGNPGNAPFSPAVWCERVLMMHHVPHNVQSDLYLMRKNRTENHIEKPLLFADLWERFMAPEDLPASSENWDNLSSDSSNTRWNILFVSDDPNDGHAPGGEASPEACAASCEQSEYCMQWSYSTVRVPNWNENGATKCHLSSSLRYGNYASPIDVIDNDQERKTLKWTSGWRKDVFLTWTRHQRCKDPTH